jgi:hypothetical protein
MKTKKRATSAKKPKKATAAPKKKTAARKPETASYKIVAGGVSFALDVKTEGLEPILGAAYLLTDRAFASLEGDRVKKLVVTLTPKKPEGVPGLKALAETFSLELATQKVRWAVAKNNLPIREYLAEHAVALASAPEPAEAAAPEPASEELTDEQRKEIEKLIAEVEDEIKTMNSKNAPAAPKSVSASWEESHESKAPEGKA